MTMETVRYDRREVMSYVTSVGLGSTLLPGILWAKVAADENLVLTASTIADAEEVAGLKFDPEEREMMVDGLKLQTHRIAALHKIPLDNSVAPAIMFNPLPPGKA